MENDYFKTAFPSRAQDHMKINKGIFSSVSNTCPSVLAEFKIFSKGSICVKVEFD